MRSTDILIQAKGDLLGRVHSDQMVLETIRWGKLAQKCQGSAEPKSLQLGLKGPSDYHFNDIAVKAARQAARGPS
jgi:hypothetical protein